MKAIEVRHPLVQHKIGLLRDASLSTKGFRELVTELGTLLAYEATADLETEAATVPGWAGNVRVRRIAGAKITLVHGNITFIDYFVLLKTEGGWKIANKAFHAQPH